MNHPLFKKTEENLSPQEEADITQELANAYRQNELGEKGAEFQRLAEKVRQRISQETNEL